MTSKQPTKPSRRGGRRELGAVRRVLDGYADNDRREMLAIRRTWWTKVRPPEPRR